MKKSFVISGLMIALVVSLSACEQKIPEEKFVEQFKSSDKEIERLNEIGRKRDEAYAEIIGKKKGAKGAENTSEKK